MGRGDRERTKVVEPLNGTGVPAGVPISATEWGLPGAPSMREGVPALKLSLKRSTGGVEL